MVASCSTSTPVFTLNDLVKTLPRLHAALSYANSFATLLRHITGNRLKIDRKMLLNMSTLLGANPI